MLLLYRRIALAAAVAAILPQSALADAYFDKGKELFQQKKYKEALPYLHQAVANAPWDSSAAYYEALDYQYLKDWRAAARAYEGVMEHFPGTQAYQNSALAVRVLDPHYLQTHPRNTASASTANTFTQTAPAGDDIEALLAKVTVSSPHEAKLPATRVTDKTWLDGSVNGKSFKFDFSGESTTISPKDAASMGLAVSNGHAIATVKVGQISESNFPVTVAQTDKPRLGKDFFRQFTYALEPSQVVATRKADTAAKSDWTIPYQQSGKDIKITVSCNGRNCTFILDQQGGETVVPLNQARSYGLDVEQQTITDRYNPVLNPNGPQRGEPGYGDIKVLSNAMAKIVVGPVNSQINIKLDEKTTAARLSSSALGGWKPVIDPSAHVIHFSR